MLVFYKLLIRGGCHFHYSYSVLFKAKGDFNDLGVGDLSLIAHDYYDFVKCIIEGAVAIKIFCNLFQQFHPLTCNSQAYSCKALIITLVLYESEGKKASTQRF